MTRFIITTFIVTLSLVSVGCWHQDNQPELTLDQGEAFKSDKNGIAVGTVTTSDEDILEISTIIDNAEDMWRLSPLLTAMTSGREYGFTAEDAFTLDYKTVGTNDSIARVSVLHGNESYAIMLTQPLGGGNNQFWVISSISHVDE